MKRRTFLRNSAAAATLPVLLNGLPITAFGRSPLLDALDAAPCQDRVLVLVQLNGGNDGLNTLVPLDQYSEYQAARPNIAIQESTLLKLNNATGLHPKMTGLSQMYNSGLVRVIQAVGYATPNLSHFRSTDIWLSASDSEEVISTGWMGRYLDGAFPGFPAGYPNASMPDPLAIQVGSVISPGLEGATSNMGMAFTDPNSYFNITNQNTPVSVGQRAGTELRYVRDIGQQIERFATPVKNAAARARNKSTLYPAAKANPLADQLKIVAQLIAGGLKTRIYVVTQSGYDTHSYQLQGGPGTPIPHGTLLDQLSVALNAFQDDLRLLGVQDRVTGMTFSEFGRRIKSNSSGGTDHGAAAPMFLFGSNVKSGILGQNPTIPQNVSVDDNIPMQYDFRSVYATLLRDWFCLDQATVTSLLYRDFGRLDLFDGISTVSVMDQLADTGSALFISPNPAHTLVSIGFSAPQGRVSIALFDATGRQIATAGELMHNGSASSMSIDVSALASGNYYVRLEHSTGAVVKPLLVQR